MSTPSNVTASVADANAIEGGVSVELVVPKLRTHPSSRAYQELDSVTKSETELPAGYLAYLNELKKAWTDLPDLTITYQDFGYSVQVPVKPTEIPNLWTAFRDRILGLNPLQKVATKEFHPLNHTHGIVRPGELTLILAPPGHGKSILLKGLAGRLQREKEHLRGEIRWNGLTAEESAAAGQELAKLCVFVEQGDVHFPMLTVRETLQFALDNSNANAAHLNSPEFAELQSKKVELMLEVLGLKECADTVVGNNMLRGISGGQKKRVTLGEMMIGQARALFLDEISTGLDASATFDIVSALKKWTRLMRGSATVALLQPTPEVFEMFDNIILAREGQIVFSGTHAQLKQFFIDINITPNPKMDLADWLTEFLTDPITVWKRDLENYGRASGIESFRKSFRENDTPALNPRTNLPSETNHSVETTNATPALSPETTMAADDEPVKEVRIHLGPDVAIGNETAAQPGVVAIANETGLKSVEKRKGLGQIISAKDIPLTTTALRHSYEQTNNYRDLQTEIKDVNFTAKQRRENLPKPTPFTAAQFYRAQSRSLWYHTKSCLGRQYMFMSRSPKFIIPRLVQPMFMGLVMGSLFFQLGLGPNDFAPRIGVMLFCLVNSSFANIAELPLASEFKLVVYKQVDAGFYSTFSYVVSVIIMHLPLSMAETTILGSLVYWMSGGAPEPGRYFFWVMIVFLVNGSMGALFRVIAYSISNAGVALNLAGPSVAISMLFGGFLITSSKIPAGFIWAYWISPYAWALRSATQNEFHSSRYDDGVGESYLRVFQIRTDPDYKWAGIGYLIGFFALMILFSSAALKYRRRWLTTGTRRTDDDSTQDQAALNIEVRIGAKSTSMVNAAIEHERAADANQLTFEKMDLSFIDLKYSVPVSETNKETGKAEIVQRQLLAGINGYARAGELTALMGSSGAGKTTLMDVIAGRKTEGTITGQILINGHPQTFPTFNRLMGYCEQQDIHIGAHTVREALEFSAKLRLPASITPEVRSRFIDQILEDLELTELSNRLIGDVNIEGLSPGQLKRVTIGVELAANPTFLFLDEPTSGLDSRAALIVLRVIHKISRRGRAVVCTIHQPSAELFCMFDRLLLLKSGGKEVYFGPVGVDGVDLVSYFMNAPIDKQFFRPNLPDKVNPASWMLDVIGAGTSAKGKIAPYDEVYKASALREQNMAMVKQLSTPLANQLPPKFDSIYSTGYLDQFYAVTHRLFTIYWRDTGYNFTKFMLMVFLGMVFGLAYYDISDNDEAGMLSKLSCIYMGVGFMGIFQAVNALPIIYRLREVFYRERSANMYAPVLYSIGLALVELPYLFICTLLFVIPFYFLVHFEYDAHLFFKYVLSQYLNAIFFTYMGQNLASVLPTIQIANIIQGMHFAFFLLFGGIFIHKPNIPAGWIWMYHINPLPKSIIPLSIQQFYCADDGTGNCPMIDSLQYGRVTKWEWISNTLATGKDWEGYYIAWLIFSILVIHTIKTYVIQNVSHQKR